MRRLIIALFALTLVVAACGGNDETTGSTDGGSSGSTQATTGSTAAPTTTTTEAMTDDPKAGRIAAFQMLLGEWEGEWTNTTFGSTGAIHMNVKEVNAEVGFVLLDLDVDGSAFGAGDPEEDLVEVDLSPDPSQVLGSFLGSGLDSPTITFNDDGSWSVVATPPALGGGQLMVEMTISDDGFEGTYTVTGPDGAQFAEGTFSASKA